MWEQEIALVDEHRAEREKEAAFYQRQEKRNAEKLAKNPDAKVRIRPYTGKATFFDQIWTSLLTVATGFFIASLFAKSFLNSAINVTLSCLWPTTINTTTTAPRY